MVDLVHRRSAQYLLRNFAITAQELRPKMLFGNELAVPIFM
jgi:hypothetical protein